MKSTRRVAQLLAPFIALLAIVLLSDPYKLPIPLLIVPFLLLGLGGYFVLLELLRIVPVSSRKRQIISGVLTAIFLLGILLQSIRQLSLKDFLILLALLVGVSFYMRRLEI